MKVNREALLGVLQRAQPGLDAKESTEQSNAFIFKDGKVYTFNDEIAVQIPFEVDFEGAVVASPLIQLLSKLEDEVITIKPKGGQLRITGGERRGAVTMEAKIALPMEDLDSAEEWVDLPEDWKKALSIVVSSCSREDTKFELSCVHCAPEHVEACDNYQLTRWPIKSGVDRSFLLPASTVRVLLKYPLEKISVTDNWAHFQDADGVSFSCRAFFETFPDITTLLEVSGEETKLPSGIKEATERAEIFASDAASSGDILITLAEGEMTLKGEGDCGWYEETKQSKYKGDTLRFRIQPSLLKDLASRTRMCTIGDGRMKIETDDYSHVICLLADEE